MWTLLIGYLVVVNLVAFVLFGIDKSRARSGQWRIPERTLLLSALVGGFAGAWLGMALFRHKTSKRSFQAKMVAVTAIDVLIAVAGVLLLSD